MEDKEIQAIAAVNTALKDLAEDERYRVIQWLANKYVVAGMPQMKIANPTLVAGQQSDEVTDTVEVIDDEKPVYDTFAELLAASGADTETKRFLVAAYWVQVVSGNERWKSFQVNNELKNTGNQIETIGNATRPLLAQKPAPIVQLAKKSSASGHGTREFKMTTAGIELVEKMLKAE